MSGSLKKGKARGKKSNAAEALPNEEINILYEKCLFYTTCTYTRLLKKRQSACTQME